MRVITIPLLDLLFALAMCGYCLFMIWQGWQILVNKKIILTPLENLVLFLLCVFLGPEKATRRRNALTSPEQ